MGFSDTVIRELRRELTSCEVRAATIRQLLSTERKLDEASGAAEPGKDSRVSPRKSNIGLRKVIVDLIRQSPGIQKGVIAQLVTSMGFQSTETRGIARIVEDNLRRLLSAGHIRRLADGGVVLVATTRTSRANAKKSARRKAWIDAVATGANDDHPRGLHQSILELIAAEPGATHDSMVLSLQRNGSRAPGTRSLSTSVSSALTRLTGLKRVQQTETGGYVLVESQANMQSKEAPSDARRD